MHAMPRDGGRNVFKPAEISRRPGLSVLCPTGLHLAKYYDPGQRVNHYDATQIAQLFIDDIELGIDRWDYSGPLVERMPHRAGLIKVAISGVDPDARERKALEAAARAHRATGAPILTHCEQGEGALEQVECFQNFGVDLSKVVLSHTDRKPDPAYHREILSTGVCLEYDSAFRWKTEDNPTLRLVIGLIEEFPRQLMLGMDAARPDYWKAYGGSPGMSFLLHGFSDRLRAEGLTAEQWHQFFVANPAAAYDFRAEL